MDENGAGVFSALYYELYAKAETAGYYTPVGGWFLKLASLAQKAAQAEVDREAGV